MKMLNFKQEFVFDLPNGETLSVDPIYRILKGLKTSTFRFTRKRPGRYFTKQGGYMTNFVIRRDFYLDVYSVEFKKISNLTAEEIQYDLGLTLDEFTLATQERDPVTLFFDGISEINKRRKKKISRNSSGFLLHFNCIILEKKKSKRLENFLKVVE